VQVTQGANVLVQGNVFQNALGQALSGDGSAGLLVFQDTTSPFPLPPVATIRNNTFVNDAQGIQVGCCGQSAFFDNSNLLIDQNNLAGPFSGLYAVFSLRTTPIPAPYNFWGSTRGPYNPSHNPAGDLTVWVSDAVLLGPFAPAPFPLAFTPPPASIASVDGRIGGKVTREATGAPLSGRTLFLDDNGNHTLDQTEPSALTDASGAYAFTRLVIAQSRTSYAVRLASRETKTATLSPNAPAATIDYVAPA